MKFISLIVITVSIVVIKLIKSMILDMYEILSNRSVVKITGVDAPKFLQNLTTNDIINQEHCYTYVLNNQGRYLFDFFVHKISQELFYLDISAKESQNLLETLSNYKMRAKVEITDVSDEYLIIYSKTPIPYDSISSYKDPRYQSLGLRSIINKTNIDYINRSVAGLYLADKYEFAIPDGDLDLVQSKSFPIEFGAEELNAISYTKGCYIGQEVISRIKYQGVVRKKIYKLTSHLDLDTLFINSEIKLDDQKIGVLCSSSYKRGIGLIRTDEYNLTQGTISVQNIEVKLEVAQWL